MVLIITNFLIQNNPTNGKITVDFSKGDVGYSNIRVTDIYGRIVTEKLSVSNKENTNLQINGNSGIYLLSIMNCDDGKQEVKKIYLNKDKKIDKDEYDPQSNEVIEDYFSTIHNLSYIQDKKNVALNNDVYTQKIISELNDSTWAITTEDKSVKDPLQHGTIVTIIFPGVKK